MHLIMTDWKSFVQLWLAKYVSSDTKISSCYSKSDSLYLCTDTFRYNTVKENSREPVFKSKFLLNLNLQLCYK